MIIPKLQWCEKDGDQGRMDHIFLLGVALVQQQLLHS
jgi:hypothetical protein